MTATILLLAIVAAAAYGTVRCIRSTRVPAIAGASFLVAAILSGVLLLVVP